MDERVQKRLEALKRDAAAGGYKLNPDEGFVADLADGLVINNDRYGLEICPCRLIEGLPEENLDIVCPCVYRDDDLADHGACFCALYVTEGIPTKQVPERRPPREERQAAKAQRDAAAHEAAGAFTAALKYPVFRCTVCGYLCANINPPRVCPVCKAKAERFERFL
jgi:ferredoxin-thioredoxin reductase catalytic subunit